MKRNIELSKKLFNYLKTSLESETVLFETIELLSKEPIVIEVSEDNAEEIHEWLNEEMLKVGFDVNYEPNREGALIEALIDKFYS